MTILREWRAELRRELADEYVAYIRDTGLAEYHATPGNLGALIAVRDLDDERAEVITDDQAGKSSALPIARRVRSAYARVRFSLSDPARHRRPSNVEAFGIVLDERLPRVRSNPMLLG
jgi:hypothetical protein